MKTLIIILIFAAISFSACDQNRGVWLRISNPLEQSRDDAQILITRNMVESWIDIPSGKVPFLTSEDASPLPCQVNDLDWDGTWDELFCVTPLGPSEIKIINLLFIDPSEYPSFKIRTNVRLGSNEKGYPELELADRLEGVTYHNSDRTGEVYQMEGPAWESDRVGFRNYLDQRNGMDIFGKLTATMVLDSVGIAGRQSYHDPDTWGMDVLKVGSSLGAGSIGYMFNDSIFRVGDKGTGSYELLFEGPLRSQFKLDFSDWTIKEMPLEVSHQISIIAGGYYYESMVSYTGTDESLDLIPGIVNMKSEQLHVEQVNDLFTALLTHDLQAEDTTLLGMALLVPSEIMVEHGKTRDEGAGITQTYYARLTAQSGDKVPYRFYAFWEKEDPRWSSPEEIFSFLKSEADRWAHPVAVKLR